MKRYNNINIPIGLDLNWRRKSRSRSSSLKKIIGDSNPRNNSSHLNLTTCNEPIIEEEIKLKNKVRVKSPEERKGFFEILLPKDINHRKYRQIKPSFQIDFTKFAENKITKQELGKWIQSRTYMDFNKNKDLNHFLEENNDNEEILKSPRNMLSRMQQKRQVHNSTLMKIYRESVL